MGKKKDEAPASLIELGIMTEIRLDELDVSPLNARKNVDDVDPELVASIESMGLLQPLIAYFDPKSGRGQVCGGQRRLLALQYLLSQGKLTGDTMIPIRHMAQDDAIEASMAENLERKDMGLADEFEAFRSLINTGRYDPDLIAKRFGYTVTYVKRRLRLAALAPEILEAVADGRVGIDGAMAYAALDDPEQQLTVFQKECKNNWKPHSADNIKSFIKQLGMTTASPLFAFAGGMKAYLKAGGREPGQGLFDDLLDIADQVPDPDIVHTLAKAKLELFAKKKLKELKAEHPCTAGVVIAPVGAASAKAPKEFKHYDTGYSESIDDIVAKVAAAGGQVQRIVSFEIHRNEPHVNGRALFISKGVFDQVTPKRDQHGYVQETPEERAAKQRQWRVEAIASELAVRDLTLERLWELASVRAQSSYVMIEIQVSDETREKHMSKAAIIYDERELERARVEAERAEAAEAAEREAAEATTRALALLDELAQSETPMFIELTAKFGTEQVIVKRREDGDVDFVHAETGDIEAVEWPIAVELLRDYIGGYLDQDVGTELSVVREEAPSTEGNVPGADAAPPVETPTDGSASLPSVDSEQDATAMVAVE